MADDVTLPGTGTVVAAAEIASKKYQKMLLFDAAAADAMGLVTASPAANTLLGRLKAIADAIATMDGHVDGMEALATAMNGYVDGLETLVGSTNTLLTTQNGYLDGVETLLTTLGGYLDSVEAMLGATNESAAGSDTATSGLNGRAQRIAQRLTSLIALLPAALSTGGALKVAVTDYTTGAGISSTDPVQVFGAGATATATITRPADATAYTANDALADSTSSPTTGGFTLSNAARQSGGSSILAGMEILSSAVPGTLLQGEIHLFDSAVTAVNDNAAWALSDSDILKRVKVIPFTLVAEASNSGYSVPQSLLGFVFTCVGSANLRFLVKVKNAYNPASGETLTVRAQVAYLS